MSYISVTIKQTEQRQTSKNDSLGWKGTGSTNSQIKKRNLVKYCVNKNMTTREVSAANTESSKSTTNPTGIEHWNIIFSTFVACWEICNNLNWMHNKKASQNTCLEHCVFVTIHLNFNTFPGDFVMIYLIIEKCWK